MVIQNHRPLNILFVAENLSYEDIGLYTLNLAIGLCSQGYQVRIICQRTKLAAEFEQQGIFYQTSFQLRELFSREIKNTRPDLVHLVGPSQSTTIKRLVTGSQLPCLITIPHLYHSPRRVIPIGRWIHRIITLTDSGREYLVNKIHIPKELIQVIHPGVNCRLRAVEHPNQNQKTIPVVGIVGPLEEYMGHKYFIEIASEIIAEGYQAQFLIIGEGPKEFSLRKYVRKLGVADAVIFIPDITKYYTVLSLVDIFLFPITHLEAGVCILEAMGCGKPVIVSAIGDTYQLIKEGKTGYLVKPGDHRRFVDLVKELLNDRILAQEIGRQAAQFVADKFSVELMTSQTLSLYYQVLSSFEKESSPSR